MSKSKLFRSVVALVTGLLLLFSTMTVGYAATTTNANPTKIYATNAAGNTLQFDFNELFNAYATGNTTYTAAWEGCTVVSVVVNGVNVDFKAFFDAFAAQTVSSLAQYAALADAKTVATPEKAYVVAADGTVATTATVLVPLTATASAVSTKAIKVVFNKAVADTTTAFVVKNGNVIIGTTVAWNDAKTEATLTASVPFAVGTYNVTFGDVAASVAIGAERLESIAVQSTGFRVAGDATKATVGYTLYNQYGADVTAVASAPYTPGSFTVTSSKGSAAINTAGTIDLTALAATDTTVTLAVINTVNAKTTTVTVTLNAAKAIDTITLGAPVIPTGKTLLEASTNDVILPYTAVDQFGNAVTLQDTTGLTFVYSDAAASGAAVITVGTEKKLSIDFGAFAGKKDITVTAIVNATGKASSVTFTVYGTASADVPTLVAPTTRFGTTDAAFQVQLTMKDGFGNDMTGTAIEAGKTGYTVTSGNTSIFTVNSPAVVKSTDGTKAYVSLKGVATGTANLTMTVNATGKTVTLPITVVAAKYPASMALVPDYTYAVNGAAITLKATFVDQYGDAITANGGAGSKVEFTEDNTSFGTPADSDAATMVSTGVTYTASAADKVTVVTAKLYNGATLVDTKTVTLTAVKADAALTYQVADLGTVSSASFSSASYVKDVEVYAVDASNHKVALVGDEIQMITTASDKFDPTALGLNKVKAAAADTDGTAAMNVVVAGNTGIVNLPVTVTFAKVVPNATSIVAKTGTTVVTKATLSIADNINLFTNANLKFVVTDQYGATDLSANTYVTVFVRAADGTTTKLAKADDWDAATGLFVAGDYTVTAITNNGLTTTVTLTLQ